jgi:hypothetical protein
VKRVAPLLLSAIYLLSSLGIAVNSHYCCGILQSTTLSESPKTGCKMAAAMKNCCKTKKQYFKVKDQHIGASAFSFNAKLFPVIAAPLLAFTQNINIPVQEIVYFNSNAPPGWRHSTPNYILNCTYRI